VLWWLVCVHPQRSRVQWLPRTKQHTRHNFWVIKGHWWSSLGFAADCYSKFCLLTVSCKWKCASLIIRRLFGRSRSSYTIPWNWWQNCKHTSLSRSLKECIICKLYGWRFRSLCRMRRTLLLDMHVNAWVCLHADRLGLRPVDANIRAVFLGVSWGWLTSFQCSMLTNFKGLCFSSNTFTQWYPNREAHN